MEICVSFVYNPTNRCTQKAKVNSVFCEQHSSEHLSNYLKYKKLEEHLKEIQKNQSVAYYLRNYSSYNKAYQERFQFREKAIAYEARDIGHQIRLDYLWDQINICVTNLERIFNKKTSVVNNKEIERKEISNKETKINVTKQNREESRRIFNTYVKTKKQIENYDQLIKEHLKIINRTIETKFQKYENNIAKLLGHRKFTIDKIITASKIWNCYKNFTEGDSFSKMNLLFVRFNDNVNRLSFMTNQEEKAENIKMTCLDVSKLDNQDLHAKIGYKMITGSYRKSIPDCYDNSPLNSYKKSFDETNREHSDSDKNHLNSIDLLLELIEEVDHKGYIILLSSNILRNIYDDGVTYFIIDGKSYLLNVENDNMIFSYYKSFPGILYSDEQLDQFNLNEFIKEDVDQYSKLIDWHRENYLKSEIKIKDNLEVPRFYVILITEYYMQVINRKIVLELNYGLIHECIKELNFITNQLDILTNRFSFTREMREVIKYRKSGVHRRFVEDTQGLKSITYEDMIQ